MEQGIKQSQRDYTLTFKLSVVDQVENGELTYKEAQSRYGIQGRSTVLVWLRRYGHLDWRKLSTSAIKRDEMTQQEQLPQTPEQRIKALEVELKEAKLKAQLFEAMLDIIKNEYGVKLPKKPSSVPLKKGKLLG